MCVRYGNVLASRGSVVPLFHEQIRRGGPVTITTTRHDAVSAEPGRRGGHHLRRASAKGARGELYIPRVPSAKVVDIAAVLIGNRAIETKVTGIRPGEKIHECLDLRGGSPSHRRARQLLRHPVDPAGTGVGAGKARRLAKPSTAPRMA